MIVSINLHTYLLFLRKYAFFVCKNSEFIGFNQILSCNFCVNTHFSPVDGPVLLFARGFFPVSAVWRDTKKTQEGREILLSPNSLRRVLIV